MVKKILSSRKAALDFMVKAGVFTPTGRLRKAYR
jgi:hypothetical protein